MAPPEPRPSPRPEPEPSRSPRTRPRTSGQRRGRLGLHADERVGHGRAVAGPATLATASLRAILARASLHAHTHGLRNHPSWRQAVPRPGGRDACRRPRQGRRGEDLHPGRPARRRCDRDREGARARARAEDPDRQVPQAHGLQAAHRLPRRDVPDRDLAGRCQEVEAGAGEEEGSGRGADARRPQRRTITSRACRAATRA